MTQHLQPVPCPPPWYRPASECFDQVKQFEQMLQAMVDKTVTDKLNTVIQQGALPPGVVDGSDAKAGQVGEWINAVATGSFPASETVQIVSGPVLPAGDWDVSAAFSMMVTPGQTLAFFTYADLILQPVPTGFSDDMHVLFGESEPGSANPFGQFGVTLTTARVRASVTLPTLMPYQLTTQLPAAFAGQTAGVFRLVTTARRMR